MTQKIWRLILSGQTFLKALSLNPCQGLSFSNILSNHFQTYTNQFETQNLFKNGVTSMKRKFKKIQFVNQPRL